MTTPVVAPKLEPGNPWPLGAHVSHHGTGVNFAVWAPEADRVELCLFDADGSQELSRIDLPCCSNGVWHGHLLQARPGLVYGYRAHGPWSPQRGMRFNPAKLLLDPWSEDIVGQYRGALDLYIGHRADDPSAPDPRDNAAIALKARVLEPTSVLAEQVCRVAHHRMVVYECHVKALTRLHPDIPAALQGSYAALAHPAMIAHYRELGITTLNLLPVQARADEAALQERGLSNHWGYAPIAWLAPEPRYWSGRHGTSPASEFRDTVAALHAAGFEVVLDVVFNHTAEGDETGPTLSLRGLANARYYHLQPDRPDRYRNWTGCGNSIDLSEPRTVELVLGALRHWVQRYGVDGFRLDLAVTLARGRDGHFSTRAAFFAAVQADPCLSRVKWIAEPWDIAEGGYQLGAFPAGWQEWNDQYRDFVRAWWLCGSGDRGAFAHRFAASGAQFHHSARAPTASINFITAHDGFTLNDLVSYMDRHNLANGEHNRDGHRHNHAWNCGTEGPSTDPTIRALRRQLQRALLATLLTSQGTPMLLAGDELGHSQHGNNNAYCQDNEMTWLNWKDADTDLQHCITRLVRLRAEHPALREPDWLIGGHDDDTTSSVLWWHPDGRPLAGDDWNAHGDRALGIRLQHAPAADAVLILVNPAAETRRFTLPRGDWSIVFDSSCMGGAPTADSDAAQAPSTGRSTHMCMVPARSMLIGLDTRATERLDAD